MQTTATDRQSPRTWTLELPRGRSWALSAGRPALLGIVNVTPDSFSDGGRYLAPDDALRHALRLLEEGAVGVDLGAESTRPGGGVYGAGARTVGVREELGRLLPVLERLRPLTDATISVDTRKAAVARAALDAGADMINDVSALGDPEMAAVLADRSCPVVLMHSRGEIASMQVGIRFADVVREVRDELAARLESAERSGIASHRVLLDPGLGFGKTAEQNLALLARLDELALLGAPLLVGASRKSFIGALAGAPADDRLAGSLAAAAAAEDGGAALLRVHDVAATRQFLELRRAIAGDEAPPR